MMFAAASWKRRCLVPEARRCGKHSLVWRRSLVVCCRSDAPATRRRCRLPAITSVLNPWCGGDIRAFASNGGKRQFYQRINEQHLAHELKNLVASASPGSAPSTPDPANFDPDPGQLKPRRRATVAGAFDEGTSALQPNDGDVSGHRSNFRPSVRTKPWNGYESMRGTDYRGETPSNEKGPRWQDLTHAEAQRLQEMYMRKKMLDRKLLWLKMQHLPNPEKDAKLAMRRQQREQEEETAGNDMYPPPFLDVHPSNKKFERLENDARKGELESRFRNRIRQEKLANARIIKANTPNVGDMITDPIKRHVYRRLVRQRVKIQTNLEEALTQKSAQIAYEFLDGVAISIVRVSASRPRATQEIHYNLTSDHDPEWVQKQLDVLAPKLRSQLALSANMGRTPALRFVPHVKNQTSRRAHLWPLARQINEETPTGGDFTRPAAARYKAF
eukprot:gnl/TRDRNA2_/TRDRNA2_198766_c0_seq1.p1 gnl/TRDRNA2_/TRDRNA2_198766_c0~~gnl/TRDRNA2_/TRDRNA2_198766_c0_seq1.p1  ORF type:complete len:444 (-),score=76.27 gnl/TRDRNA2_/TRDRNA2_198766_c0_seq1:59-1390(-)